MGGGEQPPDFLLRLIELGGPAAVMWYVLVRLERKLEDNTRTVERLAQQVAILMDRGTRAVVETGRTAQELRAQLSRVEDAHTRIADGE